MEKCQRKNLSFPFQKEYFLVNSVCYSILKSVKVTRSQKSRLIKKLGYPISVFKIVWKTTEVDYNFLLNDSLRCSIRLVINFSMGVDKLVRAHSRDIEEACTLYILLHRHTGGRHIRLKMTSTICKLKTS